MVSLTNSTIFVDVDGNTVYTGYSNVPTMTKINFFVIYNKQLNADVVFITEGADNSTSDSYFMPTSTTPVARKGEDGTMYYDYEAWLNGELVTVTMKGTNNDNSISAQPISQYNLYKMDTVTPNGEVTSASRVGVFSSSFVDIGASGSYATEVNSGTFRVANDKDIADCDYNTVVGLGEDIYAYNNDTIFMNVQLKADGTVDRVSRTSVGAINSNGDDMPGYNNVYVVAVDDNDARTPVATLVYLVSAHESYFAQYTVEYPTSVTGVTGYTVTYKTNVTSNGRVTVTNGDVINIAGTPDNATQEMVVKFNGTEVSPKADGTFDVTVTGRGTITVELKAKDLSVYEGDLEVAMDYTTGSIDGTRSNPWKVKSIVYEGANPPTAGQIIQEIIDQVEKDQGVVAMPNNDADNATDGVTFDGTKYELKFKDYSGYVTYYAEYTPSSDTADERQTLASPTAAQLNAALTAAEQVIVTGDVNLEDDVTVPANKSLELNGDIDAAGVYTLDGATSGASIAFKGNVTIGNNVTMKVQTFTADGTITVENGATFNDCSGAAFPAGAGSIVYVYGSKGQLNGTEYIGASGMVKLDADGVITISNKHLELTAGKATIDGLPAIQATDTVVVKSGATLAFASPSDALTGNVNATLKIEAGATVDNTNFAGSVQNFYATDNTKITNVDDLYGKTYKWNANADGSGAAGWLEQA